MFSRHPSSLFIQCLTARPLSQHPYNSVAISHSSVAARGRKAVALPVLHEVGRHAKRLSGHAAEGASALSARLTAQKARGWHRSERKRRKRGHVASTLVAMALGLPKAMRLLVGLLVGATAASLTFLLALMASRSWRVGRNAWSPLECRLEMMREGEEGGARRVSVDGGQVMRSGKLCESDDCGRLRHLTSVFFFWASPALDWARTSVDCCDLQTTVQRTCQRSETSATGKFNQGGQAERDEARAANAKEARVQRDVRQACAAFCSSQAQALTETHRESSKATHHRRDFHGRHCRAGEGLSKMDGRRPLGRTRR